MESKITKTIITDENREFKIGDDVCFGLKRNNKTYECFGVITDIHDDSFDVRKVQVDKMNVSDTLNIRYSEVKDGILHYTDNSAY